MSSELTPGLTVEIVGGLEAFNRYVARATEGVDFDAVHELGERMRREPRLRRRFEHSSIRTAPRILLAIGHRVARHGGTRVPRRWSRGRSGRPQGRRVARTCGSRGDPHPGDEDPSPTELSRLVARARGPIPVGRWAT